MYKLLLSLSLLIIPGLSFGSSSFTRLVNGLVWGMPTNPTTERSMDARDIAHLITRFPELTAVISHELGHAAVSKLVLGAASINVHIGLGAPYGIEMPYLIKIGNMFVYSFDPDIGACCVVGRNSFGNLNFDNYKRLIQIAAGPIAGMAACALMALGFKKVLNKLREIYAEDKLKKSKAKNCFIGLAALFGLCWLYGSSKGFIQHFLHLTPAYGPGSDGYTIWKLLGVSQKTLDRWSILAG